MGYAPNVDAAIFLCNDILPKIHEKIQNTKILIAGAQPTVKVTNLKSDYIEVSGWLKT